MGKELFMEHIQICKNLEKLWKCQQYNEVFMLKSYFNVHSLLVHKNIVPSKGEIIQKNSLKRMMQQNTNFTERKAAICLW